MTIDRFCSGFWSAAITAILFSSEVVKPGSWWVGILFWAVLQVQWNVYNEEKK